MQSNAKLAGSAMGHVEVAEQQGSAFERQRGVSFSKHDQSLKQVGLDFRIDSPPPASLSRDAFMVSSKSKTKRIRE